MQNLRLSKALPTTVSDSRFALTSLSLQTLCLAPAHRAHWRHRERQVRGGENIRDLGVPVLDTDQIARDVVEPGTPAFAQILEIFGRDILDASGRLDRRQLREKVFADPAQRRVLESITHPAIRAELARRCELAGGPYQIHVIPLLVEGNRVDAYDRVLVVDCPEEDQFVA